MYLNFRLYEIPHSGYKVIILPNMFSIRKPYLAINFTNISSDSYWDSASMPFPSSKEEEKNERME